MKKIISYVLVLSLALTIVVSAMQSRPAISAQLVDQQMTQIVGGSFWRCLAAVEGFGITGAVGGAAAGPVGSIFGGIGGLLIGAATLC
jgi:hypothetical protein